MRTEAAPGGERFVSVAPRIGHQPALNGLRGLAISMVLLAHGAYSVFASFSASVDVFFVVSGFLITTLLLEEDRHAGAVGLRNFYRRRVFRLLPMLYVVLGGMLVGLFVVTHYYGADAAAVVPDNTTMGGLWDMAKQDALAGGLYVYHVFFPLGGEVVNGGWPEIRPMIQLWSLSVEEHYYVFGVLLTLWAVHRRKVRLLMAAFLAAWVFIGVARALGHVGPRLAWYQRPDSIMIGVVMAFVNAQLPKELPARTVRALRHGATAAAVVFVGVIFTGTAFARPLGIYVPFSPDEGGSLHDGLYWGEFGFSICALAMAVMVFGLVRCPDHPLNRVLSWGPAVAIGVRSYSIYLLHVPLFIILINGFKGLPLIAVLLYFPLLVLLTELGHRYVEKPMMRKGSKGRAAKAAIATSHGDGHEPAVVDLTSDGTRPVDQVTDEV